MKSDATAIPSNPKDIKVSSVIELKETFDTLQDTISKQGDNKTIVELVLNLLCLYSESKQFHTSIVIDHIFPCIE